MLDQVDATKAIFFSFYFDVFKLGCSNDDDGDDDDDDDDEFFYGMIDQRKALSLISSRDHCQRSSPSRISDTPCAGFKLCAT